MQIRTIIIYKTKNKISTELFCDTIQATDKKYYLRNKSTIRKKRDSAACIGRRVSHSLRQKYEILYGNQFRMKHSWHVIKEELNFGLPINAHVESVKGI